MKNKTKKQTTKVILLSLLIALLLFIILGYNFILKQKLIIKNINNETLEVNTNYKEIVPKICYGNKFSCKKIEYKKTGQVNIKKLGLYKITYVINYKNKTKNIVKEIKVIDTTKPKITIKEDKIKVCTNGMPTNTILKATDNYDGDITQKIKITKKGNQATYTVKDSSGNTTSLTKHVEVKDTQKPIINLIGKKEETTEVNKQYKEKGATAKDNCDGDLTKNIIITGTVNTQKKGTYKLTYTAIDKSNNKNQITRTVKVVDKDQIIKPNGGIIYLTFDDGPGKYTEKLLDILKKYDIKATFFVTKNIKNYQKTLKREYKEGHTIALHTYTHSYSIYKSEKTYLNDLYKIENEVYKLTGNKSKIIRFPGGSSNTISKRYRKGIMTKLTKEVEKKGYIYFDWNITSGDAGETQNTKKIIKNVTESLKPKQKNVVLQHDIHNYSVNAVEEIIKYGIKKGYKFEKITEKTPPIHHIINN